MDSRRRSAMLPGSAHRRTASKVQCLVSTCLAVVAAVSFTASDASAQYTLRSSGANIEPRAPTTTIVPRFDPAHNYGSSSAGSYTIQTSDGPPASANPLLQGNTRKRPSTSRRARSNVQPPNDPRFVPSSDGAYSLQSNDGPPPPSANPLLQGTTRRRATTVRRARSSVPAPNEQRLVPNEVVIELTGNPSQQTVQALARRHGLIRMESQRFPLTGSTLYRWRIPDRRSVATVVRQLENDASVRSVQPNYVYSLQQAASGSTREGDPAQYALTKLDLPEAHGIATGENVLVAVIDSGIDTSH